MGIEPMHPSWQGGILPLNQGREEVVDTGGIEPPSPDCGSGILPVKLAAHKMVDAEGFEPPLYRPSTYRLCQIGLRIHEIGGLFLRVSRLILPTQTPEGDSAIALGRLFWRLALHRLGSVIP